MARVGRVWIRDLSGSPSEEVSKVQNIDVSHDVLHSPDSDVGRRTEDSPDLMREVESEKAEASLLSRFKIIKSESLVRSFLI